jgi:GMP synthase-like glutamine amidotransferase
MPGKALAFRHVPFEHLGRISDSLASHRMEYEYVDLFSGGPVPDISTASTLIFMGGPMSANDDLPFIRQELDVIRKAAALGKPILGVCLGSQLIAKALGARVYPNRAKEIGWYPVHWTPAGREELGLSAPEIIFHWHGETFDLPPGGELLAYSDLCRHQAYRIGKNIFGLQFHLEVTPEMIADWLTQDANCGDLREVASPIDSNAHAARMQELSGQVFGRLTQVMSGGLLS